MTRLPTTPPGPDARDDAEHTTRARLHLAIAETHLHSARRAMGDDHPTADAEMAGLFAEIDRIAAWLGGAQ